MMDLTEMERLVIEKLRVLSKQDSAFVWLPAVLSERFDILIDRGAKYNGHGSTVMEQIFYVNDQSAYHKAADPMNRLKNICPPQVNMLSDEALHNLPQDAANYLDMWICCRLQREHEESLA